MKTKYAACWIDSTRDVVRSLHNTEAAAAKAAERLSRGCPMPHLVATTREVDSTVTIGDRLRKS